MRSNIAKQTLKTEYSSFVVVSVDSAVQRTEMRYFCLVIE
jgi:hypothetical protein